MEGRRLDDFLEALQRRHTAGLCLDLDSWAQLCEDLLLNKQLLESARKDCHLALANQTLTDQEQALVLQELTTLQADFATLRLQYFWLCINFPIAFFLNFSLQLFGDDQDFKMHSNPRAGTVPGNFTECNFWVTLSSVVPFLFSGRQAEQVRSPGDHFGRTAVPDVCLRRLYPGAFDMTPNICWTFPELYVLRRTFFQFLFALGMPERTLPPHAHDWCPGQDFSN